MSNLCIYEKSYVYVAINSFLKKNLNILLINLRRQPISENYTSQPECKKFSLLSRCRLVTPSCGTHAKKVSEYLDCILKVIMEENWYCNQDCSDFLKIIKIIGKISEGSNL